MICRLKIIIGISMEFMDCLSEDSRRTKGRFLYIGGRAAIIATSSHSILSTSFVDSKMMYCKRHHILMNITAIRLAYVRKYTVFIAMYNDDS